MQDWQPPEEREDFDIFLQQCRKDQQAGKVDWQGILRLAREIFPGIRASFVSRNSLLPHQQAAYAEVLDSLELDEATVAATQDPFRHAALQLFDLLCLETELDPIKRYKSAKLPSITR